MKSKTYIFFFFKKQKTRTVKSAYYCATFAHAEELFSSSNGYIHYLGFHRARDLNTRVPILHHVNTSCSQPCW